jgi:tRNA-dihydrouridine synthase B
MVKTPDFAGKNVILAPLAGISESVFRSMCRDCGADMVVSEMVSAEGIRHHGANTTALLAFEEHERPVGIQLFGADPAALAYATRYVEEHARPDFIDLNSGCPVPKVVKKNGGSALLRDLPLFSRILESMVRAARRIPVTVKLRSGWFEHRWTDIEFARAAQDAGVSAITLHPRSRTMGFSGRAYWDRIAEVAQAVSIPVIGNGDIESAQDARAMFEQTGCDSVMIGRGALGNPWLFAQIKQALAGNHIEPYTKAMRYTLCRRHIQRYRARHGETAAAKEMKKHCAWYTRGLPAAAGLRREFFAASTSDDLINILDRYFSLYADALADQDSLFDRCHQSSASDKPVSSDS